MMNQKYAGLKTAKKCSDLFDNRVGYKKEDNLISPIVKYGMDPNTDDEYRPLIPDLYAVTVDSLSELASSNIDNITTDPCKIPIVVGERRRMLSSLFAHRAKYIFDNIVINANRDAMGILEMEFPELSELVKIYLNSQEYESEELWPVSLSYDNVYNVPQFSLSRSTSRSVNNLCNIEYYINMPVVTILDELLSQCMACHSKMMYTFSQIIGNPKFDDKISVNDIIAFTGSLTTSILSKAEQAVYMLYAEATTQIQPAGFPGMAGITFNEVISDDNQDKF